MVMSSNPESELWPGGPTSARWSVIRQAAIDAGFPQSEPLPESWPGDAELAERRAREALAWLSGDRAARLPLIHDFDVPDGVCRRPGCGLSFLDAGAECPPGNPPSILRMREGG